MNKKFWLRSAVFLGIWSMVWAWIFVLLGEAWSIAWNLVWVSFILWWIIALLSWYSLAKLNWVYPSRWWIIEYLVQLYGSWLFSGTISILFYLSAMIAISMVSKTFWTYLSVIIWLDPNIFTNIFAIWILLIFVLINLAWSKWIAKSENTIVIIKLSIIALFTIVVLFNVNLDYLIKIDTSKPIFDILSSIGLTFFAYEWFRVITNTSEDIENPKKNIMKAMIIAIILVMILYVCVSIAVFGTLSLKQIIEAQDYALAEAAKPIFWQIWFVIMWIAALVSTASSINANLYSITNVTYTMAKDGELPEVYEYNVFHSTEWLLISFVIMTIFILLLKLSAIASIWAISMLFIHLIIHIWHLKKIKKTWASKILILLAIITISTTIIFAIMYANKHIPNLYYMLGWSILISLILEILLRKITWRQIKAHTKN